MLVGDAADLMIRMLQSNSTTAVVIIAQGYPAEQISDRYGDTSAFCARWQTSLRLSRNEICEANREMPVRPFIPLPVNMFAFPRYKYIKTVASWRGTRGQLPSEIIPKIVSQIDPMKSRTECLYWTVSGLPY